ncbi:MAG: hypothetical protein U5N85_16750 [Arcicella sp.]|nr:hypothetical protein [Arcicella sp.]
MNQPTYSVRFDADNDYYIFESIGKNGSIFKVVAFSKIQHNVYNFGFGDYDLETKAIDDENVSDNGDMIKVLATVIDIALKFLSENPMIFILIEGSSKTRTQLYQRILNTYYDDLIDSYEIYGSNDGNFEEFQKNTDYESFLIRKLF